MPTEEDVWRDLRKILPKGHWTRVENPICDPGTPDVNFCLPAGHPSPFSASIEGWIELKYTESLPLEHPVLATQKIWIRKRLEAGGNVLIAVAVKKTLYFVHGREAPYINDWELRELEGTALSIARNRRKTEDVQGALFQALERFI